MSEENKETGVSPCPKCGHAMQPAMVRTAIWRQDHLFVVEDIPAQVCEPCVEQFYDDNVTDALRLLIEDQSAAPKREIQVPVYSLEARIRSATPDPEGAYADY